MVGICVFFEVLRKCTMESSFFLWKKLQYMKSDNRQKFHNKFFAFCKTSVPRKGIEIEYKYLPKQKLSIWWPKWKTYVNQDLLRSNTQFFFLNWIHLHSCVFNSVSYLRSWTKIEYSPKEKGNTCPEYLSFNPIFQIPIYIGNTYQVVLTFINIRYLAKKDLSSTSNKIDN